MKVLFLNYEYPPLGGGASVATEAILKQWATRSTDSWPTETPDMEVHLITAAVGSKREKIHLGGQVYVHRLPIGKNGTNLHSQSMRDILVYSLKALFFLHTFFREENKKGKFDVSLAFFTIPCGFLAYLVKLFHGVPYVVSLRGADVPGFSEKYDTFYLFAKPLTRLLWRKAAAVIPNSVGITKLAEQTAPTQAMQIIENGVDTVVFHPPLNEKSFSPIVFLSTSRLTPRKGIHCLIEAFAEAVQHTDRPLELWLIGEGEQRKTLEAKVKALNLTSQVKFLGRVEHERLPEFYQQAHVFVLPSRNEGMSNSALEALASGLPLIVSGTGGMQEIVTDEVNGLFIDPEHTQQFAEKLTMLAQDEAKLKSFGQESRRRAELRGWDKVAENFRKVLHHCCK